MQAAVAKDQRLAGPGHPMDDPVAFAHAAGQLFLLQVHDADDIRDGVVARLGLCHGPAACLGALPLSTSLFAFVIALIAVIKQPLLGRVDADFREQVPADAIDLRQAELIAEGVIEHGPELFLEDLRVGGGSHFIPADQPVWR